MTVRVGLLFSFLAILIANSQAFSQTEDSTQQRLEFSIYVGKPWVKIRKFHHLFGSYPNTSAFANKRQLSGRTTAFPAVGISARYQLKEKWAVETGLRFFRVRYTYESTREIPGHLKFTSWIQDEVAYLELPVRLQYAVPYRLFTKMRSVRFSVGSAIRYRNYRAFFTGVYLEFLGPAPATTFYQYDANRFKADQFTFNFEAEIKLAPLLGKRWDLSLLYAQNYIFNRYAESYGYSQEFSYHNHADGFKYEEPLGNAYFGLKTSCLMLQLGYALYRPPLTMKENESPIRTPRYN